MASLDIGRLNDHETYSTPAQLLADGTPEEGRIVYLAGTADLSTFAGLTVDPDYNGGDLDGSANLTTVVYKNGGWVVVSQDLGTPTDVGAVAGAVSSQLNVASGNAGKTLFGVPFDLWAGSTTLPTHNILGRTGNANCELVPTGDGHLVVNGVVVAECKTGVAIRIQLLKGDTGVAWNGISGTLHLAEASHIPLPHQGFGGMSFVYDAFRGAATSNPTTIGFLGGLNDSVVELLREDLSVPTIVNVPANTAVSVEINNGTNNITTRRSWNIDASQNVTMVAFSYSNTIFADGANIFPLSSEPIVGWCRNAEVVTDSPANVDPLAGTQNVIDVHVRDGVQSLGLTVALNSPRNINGLGGDSYYAPNGAGIVRPAVNVAAWSGADVQGGERTAFVPLPWLPTVVGLPVTEMLHFLSVASYCEGTVYGYDASGNQTVAFDLTRTGNPASPWLHPAANRINKPTGTVLLRSDVPICVIPNLPWPSVLDTFPVLGTTNTANNEETLLFGTRPAGYEEPRLVANGDGTFQWLVMDTLGVGGAAPTFAWGATG